MFLYKIFKAIYKMQGWEFDYTVPVADYRRSVVTAAPHTSNWDFVYAMGAFDEMKVPIRFTIKQEWMRFPTNLVMKPMGAIGIDRSPKDGMSKRESTVAAMVDLFSKYDEFCMLVTPEGSRSRREKWKTGFYHIAKGANVPIALSYADYDLKKCGVGKIIHPSDMEKDMREIMEFYSQFKAKNPENYSPDLRYI